MASLSYALFLGEVWFIQLAGLNMTPLWVAAVLTVTLVFVNLAVFLIFRSGLNLRMAEPSLTAVQVSIGFLFGLVGVGISATAEGQDVYLLTATIPMLYGILRLQTRQLVAISVVVTGCLTGILAIHRLLLGFTAPFRLDALRVVAFGCAMLWASWLAGYISSLRSRLRRRNEALTKALDHNTRLAAEDDLTKVSNRRTVLGSLKGLLDTGHPFTLGLADLDRFKTVNDSLGHLAGDRVLRVASDRLRRSLRPVDVIGRYGGDEFLILMPDTDAAAAKRIAERLRRAVAAEPVAIGSRRIELTVSLGIVQASLHQSVADVLALADRALYQAKTDGRNLVCQLDPSTKIEEIVPLPEDDTTC